MGSIVDWKVRFDFDAVRRELEQKFSPAFGLAVDRLEVTMLMDGQLPNHRPLTAAPPQALRWNGCQGQEEAGALKFVEWKVPFAAMPVEGYELIALSNTRDLWLESRAMHNCINSIQ